MALTEIAGGTQLDVTAFGDESAPPLLMICATSINQLFYAEMAQALAQNGFRVITYDHRGMGDSPRPDHPMSMADMAEDASALLDALGVAKAHVFGWSLGSTVAQELAIAHPDKVASLLLWGTWDKVDRFQASVLTNLTCSWNNGDMDKAFASLAIAFSPELVNSDQFEPLFEQSLPAFPRTASQVQTVSEQWEADLAHDTTGRLGGISAPTLVVAGEQDLLTPVNRGQAVADAIPGATIEVFTGPGSSHALGVERAEEFLPLVLKHLAAHPIS
jgi:pimeloyl-ACP methyl ester carboxylesterase